MPLRSTAAAASFVPPRSTAITKSAFGIQFEDPNRVTGQRLVDGNASILHFEGHALFVNQIRSILHPPRGMDGQPAVRRFGSMVEYKDNLLGVAHKSAHFDLRASGNRYVLIHAGIAGQIEKETLRRIVWFTIIRQGRKRTDQDRMPLAVRMPHDSRLSSGKRAHHAGTGIGT